MTASSTDINCDHSQYLKLDIFYYTHKNVDDDKKAPVLIGCDQCYTILGWNTCCFHCQNCRMYDVCLKCRSPSESELNDCDVLKAYVMIANRDQQHAKFIFLDSNDDLETLQAKQKLFEEKYQDICPSFSIMTKLEFIEMLKQ